MRLIDADELKLKICAECNAKEMCVEMKVKECDLLELVDDQPAAYDIDKVVEQIKRHSPQYFGSSIHREIFIDKHEAIDIIHNGGKE